jgi:replication factor C subunit 3/5
VEKYRPQTLGDVVSQKDITQTLQTFVDKQSIPHMLFHGPPGTGKTTTIMALARQMYGKMTGQMTLELNASDERGIDVARETIKTFVSMRHLFAQSMCTPPHAYLNSI